MSVEEYHVDLRWQCRRKLLPRSKILVPNFDFVIIRMPKNSLQEYEVLSTYSNHQVCGACSNLILPSKMIKNSRHFTDECKIISSFYSGTTVYGRKNTTKRRISGEESADVYPTLQLAHIAGTEFIVTRSKAQRNREEDEDHKTLSTWLRIAGRHGGRGRKQGSKEILVATREVALSSEKIGASSRSS